VFGESDIEGKAARVAANECGQRVSFIRAGRRQRSYGMQVGSTWRKHRAVRVIMGKTEFQMGGST